MGAQDMAVTESTNSWINAPSNAAQIYHDIMEKVLKRCKTTILHAELVWIFKVIGLCVRRKKKKTAILYRSRCVFLKIFFF